MMLDNLKRLIHCCGMPSPWIPGSHGPEDSLKRPVTECLALLPKNVTQRVESGREKRLEKNGPVSGQRAGHGEKKREKTHASAPTALHRNAPTLLRMHPLRRALDCREA